MNNKFLVPKCFKRELSFAITNRGYLIPCCYCDDPDTLNDEEFKKLLSVSKISDNESIKDILYSKQWKKFFKNLKSHKGPPACWKTCGIRSETREENHLLSDNKKQMKTRKV